MFPFSGEERNFPTLLGTSVAVSHPSIEDDNGSSFWYIWFSSNKSSGRWTKSSNPVIMSNYTTYSTIITDYITGCLTVWPT
jgi:hypothetical protein